MILSLLVYEADIIFPAVAYGNEAQMKYQYGMPVLLALVEPFVARSLGQPSNTVSH